MMMTELNYRKNTFLLAAAIIFYRVFETSFGNIRDHFMSFNILWILFLDILNTFTSILPYEF